MDSSDENRKRLREKIRSKRNQRLGTEDETVADVSEANPMLQIQNPATRAELSRRVEEEMRKVFGSNPNAMKIAEEFMQNPMSALDSSARTLSHLSKEEKIAVESLMRMSTDEDEDEAPPMQ